MTLKKKRESRVTTVLFVLAICLLLFSTIGSARAALEIQSKVLSSEIGYKQIRISLSDMTGAATDAKNLVPNKIYDGKVVVSNPSGSGNIDEYVRLTVYKYWVDRDSTKNDPKTGKSTALPAKNIVLTPKGSWTLDSSFSTDERSVFYLKDPIKAGTGVDFPFTIQIDGNGIDKATYTTGADGVIRITYPYSGATVHLEFVADGVQTHNASDAMKSAWGKAY